MKWIQFSQSERVALMGVATILAGLLYAKYRSVFHSPVPAAPIFIQAVDAGKMQQDSALGQAISELTKDHNESDLAHLQRIFSFDPNILPDDSIRLLPIPGNVMSNWIKYRNSGGKFWEKVHLMKIYGMDSILFDQLKDSIHFRKSRQYASKHEKALEQYSGARPIIRSVDINRADANTLDSLPGIGKVLAERILKYREALGGFYQIDQLREVYGISDSLLTYLGPKLICPPYSIKKIVINSVQFKELLKHPYSDYDLTRRLMNFRDQNGVIHTPEDLAKIYLLDMEKVQRLLPYLDFGTAAFEGAESMSGIESK